MKFFEVDDLDFSKAFRVIPNAHFFHGVCLKRNIKYIDTK